MALIVTYRCPHCRREHRRVLVTKTREYACETCEAKIAASKIVAALPPPPPEVVLPPVLAPKRKSRSKKIVA